MSACLPKTVVLACERVKGHYVGFGRSHWCQQNKALVLSYLYIIFNHNEMIVYLLMHGLREQKSK